MFEVLDIIPHTEARSSHLMRPKVLCGIACTCSGGSDGAIRKSAKETKECNLEAEVINNKKIGNGYRKTRAQ